MCGGTGSSNCYLVDCDVVNCRAGLGAALSRGIVPIRCAFVGNRGVTATSTSHVFYRTDAAYNCLFVANGPASGRAGCIFAIVQSSTVVNCTFLNNTCYGFAPNNTSNKHLVWNCAFLGNGEQATATSTANDVIVYTTNCVQTATGGRIATEGEPAHCQVGVSPIQYFWSPDSASCSFVEDNVLRDAGGDAGRDVAARFVPEEYLDTDFAGNPRVVGAHMDIGAIEATGEARAPATGVMTIGANVAVQTNGVACTIPTGYPFAFESFPGQVRLAPDFPVATPFFGFVIRGGWSLCRFPDLGADGGAWFTPPPAGVAISITARPAEGEKWVQADYAGGDSDGSPDKPYTTITAASAASKDYGLIHVRKGVYDTGSSLLDGHTWPARVAIDRSIAVRSVDGAAETFIVGDDATRCVAVRSWGYDVHFQGFTITGGTADGADANALRGGGFWVTAHSWANATGLTLNGNSSHVTDCVFSNNVAREAGAMVGGWAQRCVFTGNRIGTTYADRGAVAYGTVLSACVVTNNNDTHTSSICALYHCAPHNVTFAESNKVVGTSTDYRPVDMNTPAFNCAFLGGYLDNASTGVLSPAGNVGASLGALVSRPWITLYGRDSLFVDAAAGDLRLRPEFGATRDGDGTVHNAALFAVGDFEGNALKYVDGNPVPGAYSDVEILPPRDLYVDAVNGDDANDGLTSATAKQTLAAILSITRKYDTVHAARGDYNSGSETYDKAIYRADPDGKGYSPARGIVRTKVTLVADEGPDVTSITGVIGTGNGNNLGDDAVRCLTMLPNSALRGFTLRNGSTFHVTGAVLDNNVGGCILAPSCANGISGSALIENCVISNGFGRNAGCVMGGILRRCTLAHGGATSGAAISMNSRFEHCFILNNRADTGVRDCGGMSSTTYISLGESSHPSNGELTGAHSGARFENSILITKNHAASDGRPCHVRERDHRHAPDSDARRRARISSARRFPGDQRGRPDVARQPRGRRDDRLRRHPARLRRRGGHWRLRIRHSPRDGRAALQERHCDGRRAGGADRRRDDLPSVGRGNGDVRVPFDRAFPRARPGDRHGHVLHLRGQRGGTDRHGYVRQWRDGTEALCPGGRDRALRLRAGRERHRRRNPRRPRQRQRHDGHFPVEKKGVQSNLMVPTPSPATRSSHCRFTHWILQSHDLSSANSVPRTPSRTRPNLNLVISSKIWYN